MSGQALAVVFDQIEQMDLDLISARALWEMIRAADNCGDQVGRVAPLTTEAARARSKRHRNRARLALLQALGERDGGIRCRNCGLTDLRALCVDHIIPESRGGSDDLSNLRILCRSCNSSKCNRLDPEWRRV